MTLQDLHLHLDYHYWARDRVLDAAALLTAEQYTRDLSSSFRSVRDTLVHTYSAEWNWALRIHGQSPTAMLQPGNYPDVPVLRAEWVEHEAKMRGFLAGATEADVGRIHEYRTLAGQTSASALWQIVLHMVNHASYHRGQVTTMLRQLGAGPARSMDLIAFYRERG